MSISAFTSMLSDFDEIAMKVVPKGHDRSRSELREDIARHLALEVEKALAVQRAENFPELAKTEAALKVRAAELDALAKTRSAELDALVKARSAEYAKKIGEINDFEKARSIERGELERALVDREKAVRAREDRMDTFLKAFDAYEKWLDGDGKMSENGSRFAALATAVALFKKEMR